MREMYVTGLGTYLPRDSVPNERLPPLEPRLTISEMNRIGVLRRGIARDGEGVAEMAAAASRRALVRAGVAPRALDFVILANWSERRYVPDVAPRLQALLGAEQAFAFDVGCACSGFVYGLSIAHGFLQNQRFRRGLVVAADRSTSRVRPASRGTLLFGDGAAAAVVEAGVTAGIRVVDYELTTDGSCAEISEVDADGYLRTHVRQRELNELAVRSLVEAARRLLSRRDADLRSVDFVVPHSGTPGIQALLAERLEFPPSKILTNLTEVGNLAAASIPTAIDHYLAQGTLQRNHRVLAVAVGLGWHSVALLVEL